MRILRCREVKWLKVLRSLDSVWRMFRKEAIGEAVKQMRFLKYARSDGGPGKDGNRCNVHRLGIFTKYNRRTC